MASTLHNFPPKPELDLYDTPEEAMTVRRITSVSQLSCALGAVNARADSLLALITNGVESDVSTKKVTLGGLYALQGHLDQIKMMCDALDRREVLQ